MQNINRIITVAFLMLAIAAVMFFFNGMCFHTISEQNIKSDFLQQLEGMENDSIIKEYYYNNSKTVFFENQKGQKAIAVYVKSIYNNKWKLYYLSQFQEGKEIDSIVFIDDHILQYQMKYSQNETGELSIDIIGEQKPLLAIRLFSIGVIVAAATLGRIVGIYMERKKVGRIDKK